MAAFALAADLLDEFLLAQLLLAKCRSIAFWLRLLEAHAGARRLPGDILSEWALVDRIHARLTCRDRVPLQALHSGVFGLAIGGLVDGLYPSRQRLLLRDLWHLVE